MLTFSYSLMHFLEDGLCAFAMYTVFLHKPDAYLFILIYNFCAFALQMPIGALCDLLREKQKDSGGRFQILPLSSVIAVLGVFVTFFGALTHPIVLGIGNALFHVGGGLGTIDEDRKKGLRGQALGIFVAPGAMGLYLGTVIGKITPENKFGLGVLVILFAFMIATMILYLGLFMAERKRLLEETGTLKKAPEKALKEEPGKPRVLRDHVHNHLHRQHGYDRRLKGCCRSDILLTGKGRPVSKISYRADHTHNLAAAAYARLEYLNLAGNETIQKCRLPAFGIDDLVLLERAEGELLDALRLLLFRE